jgi:hypothetical protein
VAGNDSNVAVSGSSTFPTSTAPHGLTRDRSTPRMGSQASSFSPQDPPLVQLLREAANWCLRRLLRVLGFDQKRTEIRALWPPIYRGFGLISKRIRSRSCFDPSIELVSALVGINLKGKTPGAIRVQDELARAADPGPATPSQLGSAGLTSGLSGRCAQGTEAEPDWAGWASIQVLAHDQ